MIINVFWIYNYTFLEYVIREKNVKEYSFHFLITSYTSNFFYQTVYKEIHENVPLIRSKGSAFWDMHVKHDFFSAFRLRKRLKKT